MKWQYLSKLFLIVGLMFILHNTESVNAQSESAQWTQIGFLGNIVSSIVVDPTNSQNIYVASSTVGFGIYKTTDGGQTWNPIKTGLPGNVAVVSLAIDPQNPQVLYAATLKVGTSLLGGVYKSTDGGDSWVKILTRTDQSNFWSVAVDPINSQVIYVIDDNPFPDQIFKSVNGGATWIPKSNGMTSSDPRTIIIDSTNSQILYLVTGRDGICKSINGGDSWGPINSGLNTTFTRSIAINPSNGQVLYVGVGRSGGLYKSTNGGNSWTLMADGLNSAWVDDIAIDPSNADTLYIGTQKPVSGGNISTGVYRSTDGANSWEAMNEGFPQDFSSLYIDNLAIIPGNPGTLLAGTSDGLWTHSFGAPLSCSEPVYPGVEHCTKGAIEILRIDPNQASFETVLPIGYDRYNQQGDSDAKVQECRDVNVPDFIIPGKSTGPGCYVDNKFPGETVEQMATRYEEDKGYSVIGIFNTDLFSFPDYEHGPEGLTVKNGVRFDGLGYNDGDQNEVNRPSLSIKRNGDIRVGKVTDINELPVPGDLNSPYKDQYWNSIGGHPLLVANGISVIGDECPTQACGVDENSLRGRTAVGKTADGKLTVVVIQDIPGIEAETEVTLGGLVNIMLDLGAVDAINLDGGGSSQLWYNGSYLVKSLEGEDGRAVAEGLLIYSEKPSTDLLLETTVHLFLNDLFQHIFRILPELSKLLVEITWPGSDVNLTLTQPDGTMLSLSDPSVTYTKTGNYISITVQNPQPGDWELGVQAIDMPIEGEDVQITIVAANSENIDITPPATIWTLDGTAGENGWFISDVSLNLTATDDLSGVAATLYSVDGGNLVEGSMITLEEEGIHTAQFYSIDNDNNVEGTQTILIHIDKTAPTLTVPDDITVEGNTVGGSNVTLPAVTATDIVDPLPIVSCDRDSGFFPLGVTAVTCTAIDAAGHSNSSSFNVMVVDTTSPSVICPADINSPVGQSVLLGTPEVSDIVDSSPVVLNDTPESYVPGSNTVTWIATDSRGNTVSCIQTVKLIYNFNGFFAPVDNPPLVNRAKAGRAIPVKFSLDGDQGLNILAGGFPVSQELDCDTSALADDIEETATAGDSSLSYDANSDQYTYVWKTDKGWANTCRQMVVRLDDETDHVAKFEFK